MDGPSENTSLSASGICKGFPGVRALDSVDFDLLHGEVHALLGENGAGKSTLVKIFTGVYQPDAGSLRIDGRDMSLRTPAEAFQHGISVIHQELDLIPTLTVAQNLALGRAPVVSGIWGRRFGVVRWTKARQDARANLDDLGVDVDPDTLVADLGISQAQLIAIAKALSRDARILIMDEPTSALSASEVDELFHRVRRLKARGVSIIYITHKLEEIFRIADRVTVLRDGHRIATLPISEANIDRLISMMVGRSLAERYPRAATTLGDTVLNVKHLNRRGILHDISFDVRSGEIVGIAGLVGSGRTSLARALFGADPADSGEIVLDGRSVVIASPQDAINTGLALLTEDRRRQGLILEFAIRENIVLPPVHSRETNRQYLGRLGTVDYRRATKVASGFVRSLAIKAPSVMHPARSLSGGNQQKVVVAKWLATKARVFIFDEPTRGIDVGAKAEIYRLMGQLAAGGAGIIMISSEVEEILAISTRILVMREGRIVAALPHAAANKEVLLRYAATEVEA